MNLPSSLLRATFRLRVSRSITSTQVATHFPTTRKYSQEHSSDGYRLQLYHNPLHDLVAEITIPNGTYTLEFARFPVFPSPKEPSTSCLLWGETKAALLAEKFQPSPPSVPSRPGMYFLGPSSVAGTGVFAQEDIECGEAIMVERPFLMAFSNTPDNFGADPTPLLPMGSEALGLVVAERLSRSEQTDFYRLFSSDNSIWQIMSQNSIPVSEPLPGPYSGPHSVVCRDVSRINHSCTPNVESTWDPTSFTVLIHSNTRISKGEELFRPYRNILEPRSERMEQLYQIYDFKCACPSCSLPDDESAKSDTFRRFLMQDLVKLSEHRVDESGESDPEFAAWLSDPSLPDDHITSRSEHILNLMEEDGSGILGLRLVYYTRLMRAYIMLGDEEKARRWASTAMEIHHPNAAEVRAYASDILASRKDEEWCIRRNVT